MYFKKFCRLVDVVKYFMMLEKVFFPLYGIYLKLAILSTFMLISSINCTPARVVQMDAEPVDIRRVLFPSLTKRKSPKNFYPPTPEDDYYYEPSFLEEDSFSIGPEDAVSDNKFSPPATFVRDRNLHKNYRRDYPYDAASSNHKEVYVSAISWTDTTSKMPTSPYSKKYPSSRVDSTIFVTETTVTSDFKVSEDDVSPSDFPKDEDDSSLKPHLSRNNFTNTNDSHEIVSSDTVYQYHPPPVGVIKANSGEDGGGVLMESTQSVFNTTVSPVHDIDIMLKDSPEREDDENSDDLFNRQTTTDSDVYYSVDDKAVVVTSMNGINTTSKDNNTVEVLYPIPNAGQYKFSSGAVAGIVIAVLTCVTLITSSVIYLLYRRYNGTITSVVESKFNSDSCGYLDDSIRSSVYLNNHIELPKDNSEEMTSLDNDSFLNSLETMTIQNYWADNTKNTKV